MIVRLDAKSVVYKRIKERIFSASTQGMGFPSGSVVKNLPINAGDLGLIPGLGRSPGEEMATHSSVLAWEIPWTEEPGRLQSLGWQNYWTQLSD